MKKITARIILLLFVTILTLFGPYNFIQEMNEKGALRAFIKSDGTFKGEKIVELDYRGSDTYFVRTREDGKFKNYIVMNDHTSVMNGHWKVFEETSKEHYY
ncbi:MAG: hypothetical protein WCF60_13445 [Anaerobacillus sp.]